MFRKITLLTALCAIIGGRATAQYCADNPDNNSTFDWTASGWYLYIKPNDNSPGQLNYLASPYHPNTSNTQPNTSHIEAATGLGDYHPADGWVLINELMGLTDSQSVVFPQFVLYNRFESKLRYFVFLAGIQANDVEIHVHFEKEQSYVTHVSAALEHAFTPMDVVEGYQDKKIMIAVPNKGFFAHGVWAMADIPIAYDPCTCQYTSALTISTITSTYSTFVLNLDGGGDITQVIGPAGSQNNRVTNAGQRFANITGGINSGISKGVSAYKTAGELAAVAERLMIGSANRRLTPDLIGTLNTIPGININAVTGISSPQANFLSAATNLLPGQADAINQVFTNRKLPDQLVPDWLKTAVPFASTAFALLDFIIGGGKSTPPQPMHFNADFSFKGEGNFTQSLPQASTTFYIPGNFSHPAAPEERLPVYDKVMGILNLVEQPVMYYVAQSQPGEFISNYSDYPGNVDILDWRYTLKLSSPLKYAFNSLSGLDLNDIRGAFYFTACPGGGFPDVPNCTPPANLGLIEDEPGIWRTPYMPMSCLDSYTMVFSPGVYDANGAIVFPTSDLQFTDIQLHLVAKLTSPVGEETAWAARYRVNTTPAPYSYEDTPPNPFLNVQENVEVEDLDEIMNNNILSWSPLIIKGDVLVTPGRVEDFLNANSPQQVIVTTDPISGIPVAEQVPVNQILPGSTLQGPLSINRLPNCGSNPPVDAAWLADFCHPNNMRYNPILARSRPVEEVAADTQPVPPSGSGDARLAPNPVGDQAWLEYQLAEDGPVTVFVSDYTGRQVIRLLAQQWHGVGFHQIEIPAGQLPAGVYFVTLVRQQRVETLKMVKR